MRSGESGGIACMRTASSPISSKRANCSLSSSIKKFTYSLLRQRMKAYAFCSSVRGLVNLPVRETFALDALKNNCRTFPIADLAGVPFEIPFRKVARQMGFADRMMRAEQRAQGTAARRRRLRHKTSRFRCPRRPPRIPDRRGPRRSAPRSRNRLRCTESSCVPSTWCVDTKRRPATASGFGQC